MAIEMEAGADMHVLRMSATCQLADIKKVAAATLRHPGYFEG
jgi:hypothetical protein